MFVKHFIKACSVILTFALLLGNIGGKMIIASAITPDEAKAYKGTVTTIDANLNEWDDACAYNFQTVSGNRFSGYFKVKWDNDAIYVAAEITTSSSNIDRDFFRIMFDFDGVPTGDYPIPFATNINAGVSAFNMFPWSPGSIANPEVFNGWSQSLSDCGIDVVGKETNGCLFSTRYANGKYYIESKWVPSNEQLSSKLFNGSKLGFNVQFLDLDSNIITWTDIDGSLGNDLRQIGELELISSNPVIATAYKSTVTSIDANLDEWADSNAYNFQTVNGNRFSGFFKVKWDYDAIYVAAEITTPSSNIDRDFFRIMFDFDGVPSGYYPIPFATNINAGVSAFNMSPWCPGSMANPQLFNGWSQSLSECGIDVMGKETNGCIFSTRYANGKYYIETKWVPSDDQLASKLENGAKLGFNVQFLDLDSNLITWTDIDGSLGNDLRQIGELDLVSLDAGDEIAVQDLGKMQLTSYPVDIQYDWKFSVIKDGNLYKMWFTRSIDYDAIWYAESLDMKNWTNERIVLMMDSSVTTQWIKTMVGNPNVLKVNDLYYMYFEAPATTLSGGECDNNVFLATSTNGLDFTMYPNNQNPVPVIKMPTDQMGIGKYGVGQPTALYHNGEFYVYYTDSISGDYIRLAKSIDGINFGAYESHPRVFDKAAIGVKYNNVINKFVMAYGCDPSQFDATQTRNEVIYYNYSNDGINWDTKSVYDNNPNILSSSKIAIRGYPDFVCDWQGNINTETMYVTYMEGDYLQGIGEDFRITSPTWDGHFIVFNPKQFENKPIILPNGLTNNQGNLALYNDATPPYDKSVKNSGLAKKGTPTINVIKESLWNNAPILKVNRLSGCAASIPTATNADVQVLWDNNYLYLYGVVKDQHVSYSYPNENVLWQKDSIDLFIDVNNDAVPINDVWHGPQAPWTSAVYGVSICANGAYQIIGSNPIGDFTGINVKRKITSTGYEFEARIPWHALVKSQITANKTIGFEMQINDDPGVGKRKSILVWNDLRASAYNNRTCFGSLQLIN